MRFSVDTTSATPIYAQIIAQVKHAVAAGVLQPGDALPSLRELASELRVNPMTVARAYREMEATGIITTEHGRGSRISAGVGEQSPAYRREALVEAVDRLLAEAHQLGASPEDVRALVDERLRTLHPEEERITHGTRH